MKPMPVAHDISQFTLASQQSRQLDHVVHNKNMALVPTDSVRNDYSISLALGLGQSVEAVRALSLLWLRKRRKKQRRFWVRSINLEREALGEYHKLVQELRLGDSYLFHKYFRISPDNFQEILGLVEPMITKKKTNFRKPISPAERLAITLRYLATGDSQQTVSFSYRVGHATVCKIIRETCNALWVSLSPIYLKVPGTPGWKQIAKGFSLLWNFPNCCGAIDGKHIVIKAPPNSGSLYYNYKHTFSVVLLAVCDAQYRFTLIDVGNPGKNSDSGIFSDCNIGIALENSALSFPEPETISGITVPMPYVWVGDEGFPLKENLMRPYPGRKLSEDMAVFNYRLSRARRVIENTFGILAMTWRIFQRPILLDPDAVKSVVKACCCLHNYIRRHDRILMPTGFLDHEDREGNVTRGEWRNHPSSGLQNLGRLSSNTHKRMAASVRDNFKTYFISSVGGLSWQKKYVNRGQQDP